MPASYFKIDLADQIIEQKFGNTLLQIQPGCVCSFGRDVPSNTPHFHNCFELNLIIGGSGYVRQNGHCFQVGKGDILIMEPEQTHEIFIQETQTEDALDILYFLLRILPGDLPKKDCPEEELLLRFLHGHETVYAMKNRLTAYIEFLTNYTKLKTRHPLAVKSVVTGLVLDCFANLTTRQTRSIESAETLPSRLDEIQVYIAKHLGEKISLEQLAQEANTSVRNLQVLFRRHFHTSVSDYLIRRRMSVAANYLRMNLPVHEVGKKVGIKDPAQFSRAFKKQMGLSPKQYQQAWVNNTLFSTNVPENH